VLMLSSGLENLALDHVMFDDEQDTKVVTVDDFSLPKLTTLELYGDGTKLAKTLIHSNILSKLERIILEVSINNEETMINLLVAAARLVSDITPFIVDIREDTTAAPYSNFIFSYAWDSEGYAKENFRFVNTWNTNHDIDLPKAALLCMKELNLEDMEEFICVMHRHLSKEWWRALLGRASNLGSLHLERLQSPGALMHAIAPDNVGDQKVDSEPSIFLPSLGSISFAKTIFTPSPLRSQSALTNNISHGEGSIMHLVDCIRLRKERGYRMEMVELPGTRRSYRRSSPLLRQCLDTIFYLGNKGVDDSEASDYEQGP
jgi:hypothetical protein